MIGATFDNALGGQLIYMPVKWLGKMAAEKAADYLYPIQEFPNSSECPNKQEVAPHSTNFSLEESIVLLPSSSDYQPEIYEEHMQQPPTLWSKANGWMGKVCTSLVDYFTTLTPKAATQLVAKSVGSAAAAGAFVFVVGPPGLIGLPAFWFVEGSTKSFAAFVSDWWSEQALGSVVDVPFYELWLKYHQEETQRIESIEEDFPRAVILSHPNTPAILPTDLTKFIIENYLDTLPSSHPNEALISSPTATFDEPKVHIFTKQFAELQIKEDHATHNQSHSVGGTGGGASVATANHAETTDSVSFSNVLF